MSQSKGKFKGLLPLVLFLIIFVGTGVITGDFENMPLLVAFMISAGFALFLNNEEDKLTFGEKVEKFTKGGGDSTIILLVVIFLLAGAFYAVAENMGAVDSTVNFGLSILPKSAILPGVFMVGCIISFAMGTSMGTVTALAPIGLGIADQTGINVALILGTVVGGAMFGDNLSFISDTTIAATKTQGVKLIDKFKMNILIVLPAVIITFIILFFYPTGAATIEVKEYQFIEMLPYLAVIISALAGLNVINVLVIGVLTGGVIGLGTGQFAFFELLGHIQTGMGWMQNMAIIAIIIGGIVALMDHYGGIDFIIESISKRINSKKGAEGGIGAIVSLIDIATANNTVSIITAGPLARDISEEYDIDPRRTASLLDIFSAAFQGVLPYGGQLLIVGGMAETISPISVSPYCFYPMLLFVFAVLAVIFGIPRFKGQAETDEAVA